MSDAVGVRIRVDGVDVRERKGLEMETGMAFYSISFDSRDPFGSLGQARLGVMVEPPRVMVPAGGLRIGTGVNSGGAELELQDDGSKGSHGVGINILAGSREQQPVGVCGVWRGGVCRTR